jgi:hypothetical protein
VFRNTLYEKNNRFISCPVYCHCYSGDSVPAFNEVRCDENSCSVSPVEHFFLNFILHKYCSLQTAVKLLNIQTSLLTETVSKWHETVHLKSKF